MSSKARITSEAGDSIDELREEIRRACADQVVDLGEYGRIMAKLSQAEQQVAAADEALAIVVCELRRGLDAPRAKRLRRERAQRTEDPRPAA